MLNLRNSGAVAIAVHGRPYINDAQFPSHYASRQDKLSVVAGIPIWIRVDFKHLDAKRINVDRPFLLARHLDR
jgi:hypothetical protein